MVNLGGINATIVANVIEDNLAVVLGGLVVAIGAGLFLAMFAKIMANFGNEVTAFKVEVEGRFDRIEQEVQEVQEFRTEFLAKGWTHMPPGMADGPAMVSTMAKIDAKLDQLGIKLDAQQRQINTLVRHDEERDRYGLRYGPADSHPDTAPK